MKFLFLILICLPQMSFAGPRVIGNGGDGFSLQFIAYGQKILSYLENSEVTGLNVSMLAKIMDEAKVESTDHALQLNGMAKDAINYPTEKRIIFNRQRWSFLIDDERLALVLHEYLGLLGEEDANYRYSKLILKDMNTVTRLRPGADSMWIVCQNDNLVVNFLEHRHNGDQRLTDYTILFGNWILTGSILNSMSGHLQAKNDDGRGTFDGQVTLSSDYTRMNISGVLNLYDPMQINLALSCSEKWGRSLTNQ